MKLLSCLFICAALAFGQGSAEVELKAAVNKEQVEGDLKGAIEAYRKIVAKHAQNRAVAAQAMLHMAQCHEKLGQTEARKLYEQIAKSYADQSGVVAQARQRLAAMNGPRDTSSVRTRLVWDDAIDLWGTASGDGRYYSFVDWSSCDLGLRDLVTGENRKLTNKGCGKRPEAAEVEGSSVSPDGKRIAFAYVHYRPKYHAELFVIGTDGKNEKLLMTGEDLTYVDPYAWSPDGKWISAFAAYGKQNSLVLVSPDSGEIRRFPLQGEGWPHNASFSPDGKWVAYSTEARPSPPVLKLREVTDGSVEHQLQDNAHMMAWTPDGRGVLFSRPRGETYDLYFLAVTGGKAVGAPSPIYAATNIGRSAAGITPQGALLYETMNRQSETLVFQWKGGMPDPQSAVASIRATNDVGWRLTQTAAHFSNGGKLLFTVTPDQSFLIRDMQSGQERNVIPRMKRAAGARWAHDDSSLLVRGWGMDGKFGVFRMSLETGEVRLVTELPEGNWGFAISRDGKTIFHGTPEKTLARDLATGNEKTLFGQMTGGNYNLVVSRDGNSLAIRSSQSLAVVNLRTGQGRKIFEASDELDGTLWGLDWSEDDKKLVATVRAGGLSELWTLSPEGGTPVRQPNPSRVFGVSISPDGKYVATTNVTQHWQLWALENFLPVK